MDNDVEKDVGVEVDDEEIIGALVSDQEPENPEIESKKGKMMEEQEEVQAHRCIRIPTEPTSQQRAEHRCTHWPYRSWCRDCNRGRGQHDHHRSKKGDRVMAGVPTISIDFVFLGTEHVRAADNTFLVMYDNNSEAIWT